MQHLWVTHQGSGYTQTDCDFVCEALAARSSRESLAKVWKDAVGQRKLLDLPELFKALKEWPLLLDVSPQFYFFILVRHRLLQESVDDYDAATYVARLMVRRLKMVAQDPLRNLCGGHTCAADYAELIATSSPRMKFFIEVAAGNQFLMLSSFYPDFLTKNYEMGIDFYRNFTRQAYQNAGRNRSAPNSHVRDFYSRLSEQMPRVTQALDRVRELDLFLGE